jgi:hypothetical protein
VKQSVDPLDALRNPARLWTREEVLQRPSPVPAVSGLYAWFFREVPEGVAVQGCVTRDDATLLYVGIAPRAPSASGKISSRTLRTRIRQHYQGNASGSTLRLTLGCLLRERLGIQLCRTGAKDRLTFAEGERKLSEWMAGNAFVCWVEHPRPWEIESQIITELHPPLNLAANRTHPFHTNLSALRREMRRKAQSRVP